MLIPSKKDTHAKLAQIIVQPHASLRREGSHAADNA